ncbi:MAG: amidase [Betaproteobacteria bacterium]|nr:amidase [Betaproteobacteria bacterium]
MKKPPHELSATEAAAEIAAGRLTSEALVRDCLERIAEREETVQAWAYFNAESVIRAARQIDAGPRLGPLHGIPVGLKDIIETCDMPTEYGSPIYAGNRPRADAACVVMLRNAGAVIIGKTVTVEFAVRHPGKTRNPHNPAHTPGGSSSGSAAAVADHMVPLALGTQTGGSTIRPAAYCGIVGHKPSYNAINRAGVKPVAESFDTVGLMARTAQDARLLFSVMTSTKADPPLERAPRIGFCRTPQWKHADAATMEALETAVSVLSRAAGPIQEVTLPPAFDGMLNAHSAINEYEQSRALSYERRHFPGQISATLRELLEKGDQRSYADYVRGAEVAAECRQLLKHVFAGYDVLVAPSATGEAPQGLETTGKSVFNRMWTALHVPTVTIPVFKGPSGLPMGLQLVGAFGSDQKLLACAAWAHRALT